jgi:hypothetical protein
MLWLRPVEGGYGGGEFRQSERPQNAFDNRRFYSRSSRAKAIDADRKMPATNDWENNRLIKIYL